MSTHPPEWFQIVAPLVFSTAATSGIYWQPQWMNDLFARLVSVFNGG
jgi:hypothetical protein